MIQDGRLPFQKIRHENAHNPCLPVRNLARPVDVRVPQDRVFEPVLMPVIGKVVLRTELGYGIGESGFGEYLSDVGYSSASP